MNNILSEKDTLTIIDALKLARQVVHRFKIFQLQEDEVIKSLSLEQIEKVLDALIIKRDK